MIPSVQNNAIVNGLLLIQCDLIPVQLCLYTNGCYDCYITIGDIVFTAEHFGSYQDLIERTGRRLWECRSRYSRLLGGLNTAKTLAKILKYLKRRGTKNAFTLGNLDVSIPTRNKWKIV